MRVSVFISLFVLLIVGISSCHKAPKCWGKEYTNTGIIVSDTVVCNNCTMIAEDDKHFVINNQSAMNRLIYYNYGHQTNCEFNTIDFSKYTLFGVNTYTTCNFKIVKDVSVDDATKKYTYLIEINECGNCSEQTYQQNWVLIPKIKTGYSVDFVIERY